jgi:hypothetical protein
MNAELFDDVVKDASFELELFYDMKPKYYSFAGNRRKLDHNFNEHDNGKTAEENQGEDAYNGK